MLPQHRSSQGSVLLQEQTLPVLVPYRLNFLPAASSCMSSPCAGYSSSMDPSGALNSFRASPSAPVWSPPRLLSWYLLHNGLPCVSGGQEILYDFLQWLQRNFCSSAWNTCCPSFSFLDVCSIVPLIFSSLLPATAVQRFCPLLKVFSHLCHYLGQEAQLCPVVGLLELETVDPHGASLLLLTEGTPKAPL